MGVCDLEVDVYDLVEGVYDLEVGNMTVMDVHDIEMGVYDLEVGVHDRGGLTKVAFTGQTVGKHVGKLLVRNRT